MFDQTELNYLHRNLVLFGQNMCFYQTELNYGADISDLTGENHQTELNYLADNLELIIYKTTNSSNLSAR